MLAFFRGGSPELEQLGSRLAASLGLASSRSADWHREGATIACALQSPAPGVPVRAPRQSRSSWRPARSPSGRLVLFNGWFDNAAQLARELDVTASDPAIVYGAAVDAWGDHAEQRIIGKYCAIMAAGDRGAVRLARSPLRAPPLHYFFNDEAVGAASVPRALHLMGIEPRLNLRKLADNLYFNLTEDEGFYEGSYRVGTGEVVWLDGARRTSHRWFDPLAVPALPPASLTELVEEADRLLTEAGQACIAGSNQPGIQLSGGLDSTNVAARVLRGLDESKRLKSFTFLPLPEWPDTETAQYFTNERSRVEAFVAMHPRIDPYFTHNPDGAFDDRLDQMFLLTGTGQGSMPVGHAYHGIYALGREQGCDLFLSSDLGNATFSQSGEWSFAENFRNGHWRTMVRDITSLTGSERPLLRRILSLAVVPSLPLPAWRLWQRLKGEDPHPRNLDTAMLRPEAVARFDTIERARAAGVSYERDFHGYRHELIANQFCRDDIESADVLQGLEQMYGIRTRDVPAWRPFVEFCLGLPTGIFMRDGQTRWLARELGKGLMPEALRTERRFGFQGADWHLRMTPKLAQIRSDIALAREIPELDDLLDLDRMERLVNDWPTSADFDPEAFQAFAYALPRAVATIRYVRFVKGVNAG